MFVKVLFFVIAPVGDEEEYRTGWFVIAASDPRA